MKGSKQKHFALLGGLLGAVYLTVNNLLPSVPELLLGLLLGLGMALIAVGLLPEAGWRRLRKWKRRGE